jgi:hypothetical protein
MRKAGILALAIVLAMPVLALAKGPHGPKGPGGGPQIEGAIESIDSAAEQIVVDGTTVQVTPDTVIKMGKDELSFDELELGMTVIVCGQWDGAILLAHQINVKYKGK